MRLGLVWHTVTSSGSIANPWVIVFAISPAVLSIDSSGLTQAVTDAGVSPSATDTYNVNVGTAIGGTFVLSVDVGRVSGYCL